MDWRLLRCRRCRAWNSKSRLYCAIASVHSDASDLVCLLEHPTTASNGPRDVTRIAWLGYFGCPSIFPRRKRKHAIENNHDQASITTCRTSGLITPEKLGPSIRNPDSSSPETPKYYIISEVGSVTMREERRREEGNHPFDERSMDTKFPLRRRAGLKRSLESCFKGRKCIESSSVDEVKELYTITVSSEDSPSQCSSSGSSITSWSEDMPPPIFRSISSGHHSPIRRASGIIPGDVKVLEDEDRLLYFSGRRDTSDFTRLLFPSPLLPFSVADESTHRPDRPEETQQATLGIDSAHPRWVERGSTDAWDEIGSQSDSSMLGDFGFRPSPIQVDTWTSNGWLMERSSDSSIISMKEDVEKLKVYTGQEDLAPKTSDKATIYHPITWRKNIYQPFLRAAKDMATCGQLSDVLVAEAPYDEVKDDGARTLFGDISNTEPSWQKPKLRPLKPSLRDSPSYKTWLQQVDLSLRPRWDNIK